MGKWVWLVFCAGCLLPVSNDEDEDGDGFTPRPDASRIDASEADAAWWIDAGIDAPVIDATMIDAPDAPPPCEPLSCADYGASCGQLPDDGCGTPLVCGACDTGEQCGGQGTANVCAIPTADQECANGWCWEAPTPFAYFATGVFARATNDVWIIGTRGVIKHFDGTRWSAVSSNTGADLHGIWMASATDGWIVGDAGTLLRWNGTTWTAVASGTTNALNGVHGNAANNVWIVGDRITRRWNGSTWSTVGTTTIWPGRVYVAPNNKAYCVHGAYVYENVSNAWVSRTTDSTGTLSFPSFDGIAGVGTTVWAVGGVTVTAGNDYEWVWKFDGTTWTNVVEDGSAKFQDAFVDGGKVWAPTETQIWDLATNAKIDGPAAVTLDRVAGVSGEIFAPARGGGLPHRFQAGTWSAPPRSSVRARTSTYSVHAVGDTVWFGALGRALEWRDGFVAHEDLEGTVVGLAGTGREHLYALTENAIDVPSVVHYDGARWAPLPAPGGRMDLIRATATDVEVFGEGGKRWGGTAWVDETFPAPAKWLAVADIGGATYLAGVDFAMDPYTPRLAVRTSTTWAALPNPPTMQRACGITGTGASDLWVAGWMKTPGTLDDYAVIAHWNGSAWTETKPTGIENACDIALTAEGLWVGDLDTGRLLHRSPVGVWSVRPGVGTGDVASLAVDASGTLWATGSEGVIMHR